MSNKRQIKVFQDNDAKSRKAKFSKLAVSNVVNTFSPVPLPLKSTTSFHVPPVLTTSKSGHIKDQDFVDLKDRIKSIAYCFDDIKKIAPEDVASIFRLRGWPDLSPEVNMAKMLRFCVLEFLPECESPLNPLNENLVNFLLLKRLHRRVLATNEKSGRSGSSNYEGVARFACEFRYIQGARMVCAMAEVATTENILDVIKKTSGVGKELYSHIIEFFSSDSVFNFPKQISTQMMTASASAAAAELTEDENLFIGKRRNSTFENDSDSEAGPSNPKKKKSGQVGSAMWKKSALNLVDGVFSIDGVAQKVKIDDETCGILAKVDWSKVDLQNKKSNSYPVIGKTKIHQIVAANLKDENTEHWKRLGWTIKNGGKSVIGHLDDNPMNFNKSNLMWIPEKLNSWSRKDITYESSGMGFKAQLRVGKKIHTDIYADKEMVLQEKNILKMLAVPVWARDYLLKYGLLIPSKFASSYSDVSTLLACATDRQKAKVSNKVKKQQTKTSVEKVAYKDLTEEEKDVHDHELEVSGVALNEYECIVRYVGSRKTGIWWMAKDDFDNIFQDFNGELQIDDCYVNYLGLMLHLIILGRDKGQGDHDGLVGRHYRDVKMDNRKRTLLMGTHADNQVDKKDGDLPMGVRLLLSGNYQAFINFRLNLTESFYVTLGTYKDIETASKAFQSVYVQKAKITAELEKMDPTDRNTRTKHAQSYISLV